MIAVSQMSAPYLKVNGFQIVVLKELEKGKNTTATSTNNDPFVGTTFNRRNSACKNGRQ